MWSALSLIVLGQIYFFGSATSTVFNITVTPVIYLGMGLPKPLYGVRRDDYTYTPDIGAHKVHTLAAPWNAARKTCHQEGGHLAIINSVAESRAVAKLIEQSGPHIGTEDSKYVHIGFHDLYHEGEYVSIHDESLAAAGFNYWHGSEPNNWLNEDCGSVARDGKLNDISCSKFVAFVCELPYVQQGSINIY